LAGRGRDRDRERADKVFEERVVKINRCATVVKGGRRFSFSALVVVGDRKGRVGLGFGKANEVPNAVEKALKEARASLVQIPLKGSSISHQIWGRFRAAKVFLRPAGPGTGVIAGSAMRAVLELAGVQDILTKVYGSGNAMNVVKATFDGLMNLRTGKQVSELRGVELEDAH